MFSIIRALLLITLIPIAHAASPPVILVMGDSLSAAHGMAVDAGWVHLLSVRLNQHHDDYRVINESVSGETTSGGLTRLPAALSRYKPSIIIIELGANDGLRGFKPKDMAANLSQMVHLSRQSGAAVVLAGVRLPANYGEVYRQRYYRVYARVAAHWEVAFVPKLLAGVGATRALIQADNLHPTAAAQPMVLDNIWAVLQPLLAVPAHD